MIDENLICKIKSSTVAIGLVDKGQIQPKILVGSGFLFDPAGYVLTAGHVAQQCVDLGKLYNERGTPVEMATFRVIVSNTITFAVDVIEKFSVMDLVKIPPDYVGPIDLDVACGKPYAKHSNFPFLKIKNTCEYNVFDEVMMSGYPRGEHSLSLTATVKTSGIRYSPILQFGKIGGLLPWDNDKFPYALQTDIVGTGGSSGSPILDFAGNVIAIAQKIIPSSVLDLNKNHIGEAQIGITYGVTSCMFTNFVNNMKQYYETGIDQPAVVPMTTLSFPTFTKI